jgi:2-dehydropantoate 2-reductase
MTNHNTNSKVAVIGAGAIGGVTAALMKKAGYDPILVCRHQEIVDRATSGGVHVSGLKGDHRVALKAVRTVDDLPDDVDIVFLATKANDCVAAARTLMPRLKNDALLVSMQNGIAEEALARVVDSDRIIGCVVGWGATQAGAGSLEVTSPGEFVIGNWDPGADPGRLMPIQTMLAAVQPTETTANIIGHLYAKLIINACINSLGVIAGVTLGRLLAEKRIRRLFIEMMREAMAVADAIGIRVEPAAGGRLNYYRFLEGRGKIRQFKRDLFIRMIGFKYRRIKSSSLQSLERGRPTEIDFLNGYICDQARVHGVPVPANDAVVAMVHQIQDGSRSIGLANLDDPVFGHRSLPADHP